MPTLVSLMADVHMISDPLASFQPVLLRAPRLRKLDIAGHRPRPSNPLPSNPPRFLRYDLMAAEGLTASEVGKAAYPALEELTQRHLMWSGEGAEVCLSEMRWDRLRRLELLHGEASAFLRACTPARDSLSALKEFAIDRWYAIEEARQRRWLLDGLAAFLASTAVGLHELRLEGPWRELVPVIAEYHGRTLRELVLHEHEIALELQTQR